METLYTVGYAGLDVKDLLAEVQRLRAVLVDTRLRPASKEPVWNKRSLEQIFGADYIPAGEWFGNLDYSGGRNPTDQGIRLKNPGPGVRATIRRLYEKPVILLCVCASHKECHRRHVAKLVHDACGCRVVNLYPNRQTWDKREQLETFDSEPAQAELL